jgi:phosphate transport system substrate-binding protein
MKKTIAFSYLLAATIGLNFLTACNQNQNTAKEETSTSGNLKISADESFTPIVDSQVHVFHKLYKYAKIKPAYKAEREVIQDLLTDKAKVIVVARPLSASESQQLQKSAKLSAKGITTIKMAYDGIAIILNPENTDTLLSVPQLKDIFLGKTASWKQLNPKSKLGNITIVFDNNNSSTARFVQDSITGKQPLSANAYASKSNPAVIDYVAQNKNAIGVIGANWISDFDDSTTVGFINKIKVVAVSRKTVPENPDAYVQPYQAYLAQGSYPLRREVYVISREARAGLGTGFASFASGDKGQRIVLKGGLVPARGVVRLVNVKK